MNFIAYSDMRGGTDSNPLNQQQYPVMVFNSLSHITLQHIHVLSTQPGNSSVQITFITNFASTNNAPRTHFNLILHDLTLAAFPGYAIGDIFPCQLSSTFLSVPGREAPQCRLTYSDKYHDVICIKI